MQILQKVPDLQGFALSRGYRKACVGDCPGRDEYEGIRVARRHSSKSRVRRRTCSELRVGALCSETAGTRVDEGGSRRWSETTLIRSCTRPREERRTTAGLQRRFVGAAILMAMGCLLLPGRVASQEAEPAPARASILGLVYDAVTGIRSRARPSTFGRRARAFSPIHWAPSASRMSPQELRPSPQSNWGMRRCMPQLTYPRTAPS